MANMMLKSDFMGEALRIGSQARRPVAALPAQALFGKKAPKQAEKAGGQAKGGAQKAVKQAQKSLPSLPNFGGGAKKAAKQTEKKAKGGGGGFQLPNFGGKAKQAGAQAKKAGSQAKKAAPKPAKKAGSQAKKASNQASKATKGWLGGAGGAKNLDKFYGPDRDLFLPDGLLDRNDLPSYLDGTLPGDYGYDPLGLGQEPAQVEKYRANELLHARWAMLAAAGIIIPEALQANGANIKGGTWFETGAAMLGGQTLNYFAVPWAVVNNPLPLVVVTAIEVVLLGAVEKYRSDGQGPPGYSPGVGQFDSDIFNGLDNLYPGGPFDPLGLADDPEVFQELQVKEIKNGRLAMVSVLGFSAQSAVTGEGPYANWAKHVTDPFGYNLLTVLGNEDRLPSL